MAAPSTLPQVNDFSFPPSFLQPAKCLVALTGLDTRNNAVHMAIWDMFKAGRRGERKPVTYKLLTADHLYPKKLKSEVREDSPALSLPNGILKFDWIKKHTSELPAVVVFFFDLDWTDPQWEERVTECASKVQVIRSSLEGHSTELCVALIQTVRPSSSETKKELANQLCIASGLPTPNLFVMPYVERPEGFVSRLEAAFYELALGYYGNHVKRIRVSKDFPSRPQQLLSIKRQFKVAFFTDLKQDHKEASKLYTSCYKYLTENMLLSEDRIMEFKMIAGFLNYKICYFIFEYDDPRHALSQFQQHLELFRSEKGPPSLLFQHMQWMTYQFVSFGDLFTEAVRRSLRPNQTQHPGIYYYQAVYYLLERRRLQHKLCKKSYDSLPHPLPRMSSIEFVGQRPWRVGLNDNQPSDNEFREKSIKLLQAHEYIADFSYQICLLLSQSLDHFKQLQHKTDNMISHLNVRLGEEYFIIKDYEKCLAILESAIETYRNQRWWKLLSHLLQLMLKCCYVLGHMQSYVSIVFELISRFLPLDVLEKRRLQNNLNLILKGHPPHPETDLDQPGNESVQDLWYGILEQTSQLSYQEIIVSSLASCVECKAVFTDNSYSNDSIVHLNIYFRSSAPLPLIFDKVEVLLNSEVCSKYCVTGDEVVLETNQIKWIPYTFPALSETFEREPKAILSLEHKSPLLLTELHPVTVRIGNSEERTMKNIKIVVMFLLDEHKTHTKEDGRGDPPIQLFSDLISEQDSFYSINLSCDSLEPNNEFTHQFYIKSSSIGSHKISVSLAYVVDCVVHDEWDLVECSCEKGEILTLETVTPLRVSHKIMNTKFQSVDSVFYDEPFLIQSSIHCLSPWQLMLLNTQYQLNDSVTSNDLLPSCLSNLIVSQQDVATELQCVCVPTSSTTTFTDIQLSLGSYHFQWMRNNPLTTSISTKVPLPQVNVKYLPYTVTAEFPAFATQHELVTLTYRIKNKSVYVHEYEAQLVISSDFMCSGNKLSRFKILPFSTHCISFNLFPLTTGHVTFPQLDVKCTSQPVSDEHVQVAITSDLPTSCFIMPPSLASVSAQGSLNSLSSKSAVTASV